MEFTVYLAPKGFTTELVYELGDVAEVVDRLVFAPGPPRPVAWAENIWLAPQRIRIDSITDGANKLRALQRNWALWSVRHHRRARLIEEQLPAVKPKPVHIGTPPPRSPLGSWTLLERDVIVASPTCSSPFPHGAVQFVENKKDPPNRAYLKLWELFTLLETAPSPGSFCLDMGASPGGWTWVLASLGCRVLAVDKAPLEPRVEAMPGVDYRMLSAFALDPREVGPVDWFFCDVACYPDRLWRLVDRWRTFGKVRNFVCTLKFQGATDHETAAKFWAYPGSRLVHLHNNKHELTWVLLDAEEFPGFAPERDAGTAPVPELNTREQAPQGQRLEASGPQAQAREAQAQDARDQDAPSPQDQEAQAEDVHLAQDQPEQDQDVQAQDAQTRDELPEQGQQEQVQEAQEQGAHHAQDQPEQDQAQKPQQPHVHEARGQARQASGPQTDPQEPETGDENRGQSKDAPGGAR